jgi:hypothetical protein
MGRHSAPDDDNNVGVLPEETSAPASVIAIRRGRHFRAEESDEDLNGGSLATMATERLPSLTTSAATEHLPSAQEADAEGLETAKPADAKPAKKPRPKRQSGTHADLKLLREHPTLRARCAAGAVVPFVLYTAVMIVIGHVGAYLVWVWIPTVTAGVLVGSFLDSAHRHYPAPAAVPDDKPVGDAVDGAGGPDDAAPEEPAPGEAVPDEASS